MSDQREDPMDLDLNSEPTVAAFLSDETDRLLERVRRLERIQRIEQAAAARRGGWRRRHREAAAAAAAAATVVTPQPSEPSREVTVNPSIEGLQIGEASGTAEERATEVCNSCRGKGIDSMAMGSEKDENLVTGSNVLSSSFFDCNICFDMATDPVLTCCGHLFCWPCLHQWINVHSSSKECPVCKGEVTDKNVTPIYGRGSNKTHEVDKEEEEVVELKIPPRPQARRMEGEGLRPNFRRVGEPSVMGQELLQQRHSVTVFGATMYSQPYTRNGVAVYEANGMRSSQPSTRNGVAVFDANAVRNSQPSSEISEQPELDNLLELSRLREGDPAQDETDGNRSRRRTLSRPLVNRTAYLISLLNSDEAFVESYDEGQYVSINENQSPSTDDRDSFSSIAAVINSDSQTVDTVIEIDSDVSLTSPSSLRRTRNASNLSEMNHPGPRSSRRRR